MKLKEYAACGVPWLASPVGEYGQLGEQQGGRLVADGDWAEQIGLLLDDAAARERLGAAGEGWTNGACVTSDIPALERIFARAEELSDLRAALRSRRTSAPSAASRRRRR